MFGWRVLYSEVTTKIFGIFSTLFLYGFPLVPFLNLCSKILWLLAKFSTFWATSEEFCIFRSIFDRSWSEDGLGAVVAGGYECRWSFLADQHASPCFMTYRWSAGYSTGALGTLLLGHASPCFMTYKPRKWVSPQEKQVFSSNDECHRALRALFWQNETLHNSRKHVKMVFRGEWSMKDGA